MADHKVTGKNTLIAAAIGSLVIIASCRADTGPADDADARSVTTTTSTEPSGTEVVESSTTATSTSTTLAIDPAALPLPTTEAEFIEALDEAELAVRGDDLSAEALDAWGRRQQALYRHLTFNEDWVEGALAFADPAIADAVALNWEARMNLSALLATETLHDTVPAWRVVPPLPADTLIGYYKQAEAETGVPWEFVAGINLVETRMGRIQGISTAGAIGPMQFLPTTWAECCEGDPADPEDAILGAATYLTVRGGPDDMPKALWGYNNSDFYVNAVTAYAEVMMADERAYYGYHAWEIYFLTTEGLIRLPVGYEELEEVEAASWLVDHPDLLISPR